MLSKEFFLTQIRRGYDLETEYNKTFIYTRLKGIYGKKPTKERWAKYRKATEGKRIEKHVRSFFCFFSADGASWKTTQGVDRGR